MNPYKCARSFGQSGFCSPYYCWRNVAREKLGMIVTKAVEGRSLHDGFFPSPKVTPQPLLTPVLRNGRENSQRWQIEEQNTSTT